MKPLQPLVRVLALSTLPLLFAVVGGCSGGSAGDGDGDGDGDGSYLFCSPADTCPPSLGDFDMDEPVSFATDVYAGYFLTSCGGGSGCHGRRSNAAADLYFGSAEEDAVLTPEEISTLILQLTSTTSKVATEESLVVAGDWQNSWLMAKLDGCQDEVGAACDGEADELMLSVCESDCGDGMPASEGDSSNPNPFPTTEEERLKVHKVRAWIAQGALDN